MDEEKQSTGDIFVCEANLEVLMLFVSITVTMLKIHDARVKPNDPTDMTDPIDLNDPNGLMTASFADD